MSWRVYMPGSRNVGETDEPIIIEKLVSFKDQDVDALGPIKSVTTYYGREYPAGTKMPACDKDFR